MTEESPETSPAFPPWQPTQHAFAGDIVLYEPDVRLIYQNTRGWGAGILFLASALLLAWLTGVLFGYLKYWLIGSFSTTGLYLLIQWKSGNYESQRWEFFFPEQTLQVSVGEESFGYDLREVTEVIMRIDPQEHWWSSTLSGSWKRYRYHSYNARIFLRGLLPHSDLEIASTGALQQNPEDVRWQGACFAQMMAETLDVPLSIEPLPEAQGK